MTDAEKEVLKIVRQLEPMGAEKIAAEIGLPLFLVEDLCRSLIEKKSLTGSPAEYRLTVEAAKVVDKSSGGTDHDREWMERDREEEELAERERVYETGERIGEIKHRANLPSSEEVETTLESCPWKTYEQVETELTLHTLTCPAKGKEVSWHFCSTCPHQRGIDLKIWTVQCHYEFGEEELLIKTQDLFSFVSCPLIEDDISITDCEQCRYHRGVVGEAYPANVQNKRAKGWIICGFPRTIEFRKDGEGKVMEYKGQKLRIVPMKWE